MGKSYWLLLEISNDTRVSKAGKSKRRSWDKFPDPSI
jgi:hypothetical protein